MKHVKRTLAKVPFEVETEQLYC